MELAPLRYTESGDIEVLLTRRPEDDPYWPGEWHIPGTVLRATDKEGDFSTGFERILHNELQDEVTMKHRPVFVGTKFWDVLRGRELDSMYYFEAKVVGILTVGSFFSVKQLPEMTLSHHKIMIPEIAKAFQKAGKR